MANVTDINQFRPKKPEMIWECKCGGQHFYLNNDGTVECRSCKLINETIEWLFRDQNPQDIIRELRAQNEQIRERMEESDREVERLDGVIAELRASEQHDGEHTK